MRSARPESLLDKVKRGLSALADAFGLGKPKPLQKGKRGLAALTEAFGLATAEPLHGKLTVAIVGEFQRGKSTLANALLGRNVATRGRGLATTHVNQVFPLTLRTALVDTPGFDASQQDTDQALKALESADVFLYVHESKTLGDTCAGLFQMVRQAGKTVLFLLNCRNFEKWAPEENGDIVSAIEAELANKGITGICLELGGRRVTPVNALWACYGAGLLNPQSEGDRADIQKIRRYAADDLWLPAAATMPDETLREEIARRSGVLVVRDWLQDLPFWKLQNFIGSPDATIERILNRIAAGLQKAATMQEGKTT